MDPLKDAYRKMNNAPWCPRNAGLWHGPSVRDRDVTSVDGDAAMFKSFLKNGRRKDGISLKVALGHYLFR
ncbi:MAG: hypothetical protein ACLU4N_04595 [Butyricimonas faecihominis]